MAMEKKLTKIKKGDRVVVISGADKGKAGLVMAVFPKTGKVIVEKINIRTIHIKPSQENQQGGIKTVEKPIYASNVMILDPSTKSPKNSQIGQGTRIKISRQPDKKTGIVKATRISKKTGVEL